MCKNRQDLIPNILKALDLGCLLVCELWSYAQPPSMGDSSKFNQAPPKEMQICLPSGVIVSEARLGLVSTLRHPGDVFRQQLVIPLQCEFVVQQIRVVFNPDF